MAFVRVTGLNGKIYRPAGQSDKKKFPCKDCFACQGCGDDRCNVCRQQKGCHQTKGLLYNRQLNFKGGD